MDAKEFLSQATVLNEKINMDFLHLQKLRQLLDRLGGGDLQRERVQGGALPSSPATKIVEQITDLEAEIDQELATYETVLEQIKIAIAACEEQNEIRILKGRYLENRNLTELGRELGLSVSRTYALHKSAMEKISNFLRVQEEKGKKRKKQEETGIDFENGLF